MAPAAPRPASGSGTPAPPPSRRCRAPAGAASGSASAATLKRGESASEIDAEYTITMPIRISANDAHQRCVERRRAAGDGWHAPQPRPASVSIDPPAARATALAAARAGRSAASQRVSMAAPPAPPAPARPRQTPRRDGDSRGTCRGWRRPATAAPRRRGRACSAARWHGLRQASRRRSLRRAADRGERRTDRRRIAADQHHRARMARQRRRERREVLPLAVAAEDHDQLATLGAEAVQRRDRGADVGALAVVEVLDAADAWRRTATGAARPRIRAGRAASAPAAARAPWPAPARRAR